MYCSIKNPKQGIFYLDFNISIEHGYFRRYEGSKHPKLFFGKKDHQYQIIVKVQTSKEILAIKGFLVREPSMEQLKQFLIENKYNIITD